MQQYIYGNIEHKAYAYVSSEPEFFANAQRAAVLSHLMSYDVFCGHGNLESSEHQSFWMVASNLDNPSAPDRLYVQASGGDPHRTGFYVRGYMSDAEDGYLYDSRLLSLLRATFTGFEETMAVAGANSLKRIGMEDIPVQRELQPAQVDQELLRNVLLALLRKKKVIIRIPAVGAEAMRQSREYILAIYQRLPYEQRKVHGFVTGISAAKLNDKNALPKAVSLMLMDGDADLGGMMSDMFTEVFDLASPNKPIKPMARENRGKKMAYVDLIDYLAEQSPEELDAFFRFCRSCMKDDVDGNNLGIQDYTMYLDFFSIGKTPFTADSIRTWAANIYVNARNNEKWTPDVRKVLFERIAQFLPARQLEDYLCDMAQTFEDLKNFGILGEGELKRILAASADVPVQDQNAALTLAMAEQLLKVYPEGTRETMQQALQRKFTALGCQQYPCLTEAKPTAGTAAQLGQIVLPEGGKKTTPLAAAVKEQVNGELNRLRTSVLQTYEKEYQTQFEAGIAQISSFPGEGRMELSELYGALQDHYLFAELITPGEKPNWNGAIGEQITAFCQSQVLLDGASCQEAVGYVNRTCRYFLEQKGVLSEDQQSAIRKETDAWTYLLDLHRDGDPAELLSRCLGTLEQSEVLLIRYPREARDALVKLLFARFIHLGKAAWPCLTEEKPTAATVAELNGLVFPEPAAEGAAPAAILRDKIYGQFRALRDGVKTEYENQTAIQREAGLARIGAWPETKEQNITVLYDSLRQLYLYEELIVPGAESPWNDAIADRIAVCCEESSPVSLQDYTELQNQTDRFCDVFRANGGVLTAGAEERIRKVKDGWNQVLTLSQKTCATVEELLERFGEIRRTPMAQELAGKLKVHFARMLLGGPVSREQIFKNARAIHDCCADPLERQLLKQVVDACEDLMEIGRMDMEKLTACLKICVLLEKDGLLDREVSFHPWNCRISAAQLLKRISELENYHAGDPEPDLSDKKLRGWVMETLTGNADLMLAVAMHYPETRAALIPLLAMKPNTVKRDQILALYVAGCPKAMLCRGAAEKTAASWARHTGELFPDWVELPEPVRMILPSGLEKLNLLVALEAVLLALAGLVPAGLMMLLDGATMMGCLGVLAALAVTALLALAISFAGLKKPQKRFLRVMAGALIPGIAATVVCLVIHMM